MWSIDFTYDGEIMASVSEDETIKIWKKNPDESSKFPYLLD